MNPSGYTWFRQMKRSARSPTASRTGIHSSPSYRWTLRRPCASVTVTCLFSRSPRCASMTTVRLWQPWISARIVAVALHRPDHAVELPRDRRAAREEEVPADVDLERRVGVLGHHVLVAGQVHQLVIVPQHRPRGRPENGNSRAAHPRHLIAFCRALAAPSEGTSGLPVACPRPPACPLPLRASPVPLRASPCPFLLCCARTTCRRQP